MEAERFLADRCRAVEFSGIRKYFGLALRAKDPIDLSIGQPDYDAPDAVKDAAAAAIRAGRNRYTPTDGFPELREQIRSMLAAHHPGWTPEVLIASGVSGGLVLSLLALMNPGDEVAFADPYFVSYRQLVTMLGGKPIAVPSYPDFSFPTNAIEQALTPRTRLLLINSPANPTGRVMPPAEMKAAAELARRRDLLILSDEIYRDLTFDARPVGPADFAPERTIVLGGFGKTYGVTGWRLGYVAGPAALIHEMTKMQQYTFVCAPTPFQHAMLTAMRTDVTHHARDYARKRDLVVEGLSGAFDLVRPGGGFYVFPRAPSRFSDASAFCDAAAERNVFVIPGGIFSSRDTHFRVSFAAPDDLLRRGCRILCELARG